MASNMASLQRGDSQISSLPHEVLMMIAQVCPRSTLKGLRLANRSFAQMTEPLLWERLALVPNRDCLLSLTALMKESKMSHHVREIIYDAQWSNLVEILKRRPELQEVSGKSMDQLARAGLLARISLGQLGSPSNDGESELAEVNEEIDLLTQLLKTLPFVNTLIVKEEYARQVVNCSKAPAYYQQACKTLKLNLDSISLYTNVLNCDRACIMPLLLASAKAKLAIKSVVCQKLSWNSFFTVPKEEEDETKRKCLKVFQNLAGGLTTLQITFRTCLTRYHKSKLQSLGSILRSATCLKSLRLSFTDLGFPRRYSSPRLGSYLSTLLSQEGDRWSQRPILPQLETFHLESCVCTEEELKHFLKIHSTTLRHLHLSDISIYYKHGPRGCWVRIIKFLKSKLHLESMTFTKWLSNGGRQHWWVTEERVDATRLKSMVERYIVDQTAVGCPLEDVAVRTGREDVDKPANGNFNKGDWSWVMLYGDTRRSEAVISGSNFFSAEPVDPLTPILEPPLPPMFALRNTQYACDWLWDPSVACPKNTNATTPSKSDFPTSAATGHWKVLTQKKFDDGWHSTYQNLTSYAQPNPLPNHFPGLVGSTGYLSNPNAQFVGSYDTAYGSHGLNSSAITLPEMTYFAPWDPPNASNSWSSDPPPYSSGITHAFSDSYWSLNDVSSQQITSSSIDSWSSSSEVQNQDQPPTTTQGV